MTVPEERGGTGPEEGSGTWGTTARPDDQHLRGIQAQADPISSGTKWELLKVGWGLRCHPAGLVTALKDVCAETEGHVKKLAAPCTLATPPLWYFSKVSV